MEFSEKQVNVGLNLFDEILEISRQKSILIGNNVEAMQENGLSFWKALETTLKVYDI